MVADCDRLSAASHSRSLKKRMSPFFCQHGQVKISVNRRQSAVKYLLSPLRSLPALSLSKGASAVNDRVLICDNLRKSAVKCILFVVSIRRR
jgi:hypothetical protein